FLAPGLEQRLPVGPGPVLPVGARGEGEEEKEDERQYQIAPHPPAAGAAGPSLSRGERGNSCSHRLLSLHFVSPWKSPVLMSSAQRACALSSSPSSIAITTMSLKTFSLALRMRKGGSSPSAIAFIAFSIMRRALTT